MWTIIGGKSRNLGNSRLLVSKKKGGILPRNLSLSAQLRVNNNWDLNAFWLAPTGTEFLPTGYQIELQKTDVILPAIPSWGTQNSLTGVTFSYTNLAEGIYKVRVRAQYAGGPSEWVESNVVNSFLNLKFDLSSKFNLTGRGSFASG